MKDPAGVERVRSRIGEVADHGSSCSCHPVELACCSRGKYGTLIKPSTCDGLDALRFAWHVGPGCSVRPDARARVIPRTQVWWIGSPGWWLRSMHQPVPVKPCE